MSTVEQFVPLTEADRKILTTNKNRNVLFALLEVLGVVALLALLVLFHTLYCLIALPITSLILALAAIGSFLSFLALSKDLRQGQKVIFTAPIEDQNMDVRRSKDRYGREGNAKYTFWVKAGGRKLTVTEEQYYQLKKGDQVAAQVGPRSGTLFVITKYPG